MKFGGKRRRLGVVAATLFVALSLAPAAQADTPADASNDNALFVVMSGDESFSDAVIRMAASDEEYARRAKELVTSWQALPSSRKARLNLNFNPESPTKMPEEAQLRQLSDALSSPGPVTPTTTSDPGAAEPSPTTIPGLSSGSSTNPGAAPMALPSTGPDPGNPNLWPVNGSVGSGRTVWVNMQLAIAGAWCTNNSGCSMTDKITGRVTVNPGAVSNKINVVGLYFPNSGNFDPQVKYVFKSINRGTVTGSGYAYAKWTGGTWIHGNGRSLNGTVLTVGVALGTIALPIRQYVWGGGKTSDATCNTINNVCHY